MNLFIDTNILLSFYHLTDEDLEELRKLIVLIEQGEIVLFLPSQVQDEFKRNRDGKIADGLKRLTDQRLPSQFPAICKHYDEYDALRKLVREYDEVRNSLLDKMNADISDRKLKADQITEDLFSQARVVQVDETIVLAAQTRCDTGNPPGKRGSLGDALNWETVLASVPDAEDLYFISDDSDYASALDKNAFDSFLLGEWQRKKMSDLVFYRRLSSFFKDQFPEIKLASEVKKEMLIRGLSSSPNFATTHTLIGRLSAFSEFTRPQLNALVNAAVMNNQVHQIMGDPDIWEFFNALIKGRERLVDEEDLVVLREHFRKAVEAADQAAATRVALDIDDDDDLPF